MCACSNGGYRLVYVNNSFNIRVTVWLYSGACQWIPKVVNVHNPAVWSIKIMIISLLHCCLYGKSTFSTGTCEIEQWWNDTQPISRCKYIPRNMLTVFALLCFVVVIHWLIYPYPSGLLHRHCGNLMIAPVPAKQPWWIWINTSFEFIMNDYITTTKQGTTKPCAYFLGYTVCGML